MSSKQTYPKFRKREIMILDKKKKPHRAHDEASMYNMISTLTS